MGWTGIATYYLAPKGENRYDVKGFLDKEFAGTSVDGKTTWTIIKSLMVGTTYYAAIRRVNETKGEDRTFGCVTLTSFGQGYFNYKDMTESMGPCEYACPESILKLLSPLDPDDKGNEYAIEWRNRCHAYNLRKKKTDKIKRLASDDFVTSISFPAAVATSVCKIGDIVKLVPLRRDKRGKDGKIRHTLKWYGQGYTWPNSLINWDYVTITFKDGTVFDCNKAEKVKEGK